MAKGKSATTMAGQGSSDVGENCDNPREVFRTIVMLLRLVTYLTYGTSTLSPDTFEPQITFGSKNLTLQVMLDALGSLLVEDHAVVANTAILDPTNLSVYAVHDTAEWNLEKIPITKFTAINNPQKDDYGLSLNEGNRVKRIRGAAAWSDIVNDSWMAINWG